jgi:hypothetical protein
LALLKYRKTHETVVARIVIDNEHEDNHRFAAECSEWFDHPITELRSDKYKDCWDVWERKQYIAGINGAPCTTELKKEVRRAFQRPGDRHIWGYTYDEPDERERAKDLQANNLECDFEFPLIDAFLTKPNCHAIIEGAGIKIPVMYELGFENNNCIGCPKGGCGYWNKIRDYRPDIFDRMCELSRRLGVRLLVQDGERIFLDQLRPGYGNIKTEPKISCSLFCNFVADQLPK